MAPTETSLLTAPQLDGLYAVAHRFLEAGTVVDALRAFRVMVRFAPTDERGWLGLGTCHEQLADDEVAAELFGAGALVSSPPSARCLLALSRLRAREGDWRSSRELLDDARSIAADSDPALLPTIAHERGAAR